MDPYHCHYDQTEIHGDSSESPLSKLTVTPLFCLDLSVSNCSTLDDTMDF
jgi:hypothetical protein